MRTFDSALEAMTGLDQYGPTSFRRYCQENGVSAKTAPSISVQTLSDLAPELRAAGVMVLRCGAGADGTDFALVRAKKWPADFFLSSLLIDPAPTTFIPPVAMRDIFAYQLLRPVERTLVNLMCVSGVLGELLGLDEVTSLPAPAVGASTYDFEFLPHSDSGRAVLHRRGQVEVDALVLGRRDGRDHLFVVEAKFEDGTRRSKPTSTLAKHKLVFPVLGLWSRAPAGVRMVPAYVRCIRHEDALDFYLVECSLDTPNGRPIAINDLMPIREAACRLPFVSLAPKPTE